MKGKNIAVLMLAAMLAAGCSSEHSFEITKTTELQENNAVAVEQASIASLNSGTIYEEDAVINKFITDYNMQNEVPVTEIFRGNIDEKAYGHIGDVRIEMMDSYNAYAGTYNMSIYGGDAGEETEATYEVFSRVAKVMSPKLTDDEISSAISEMRESPYIIDDIKLGDLTVSYIPPINASRIDVATSIYAKDLAE